MKYEGDFVIQDYANLPEEYETSDGQGPPRILVIKGPPSLRKIKNTDGAKAYVVSNGGPALDLVEATEV